MTLAEVYEASGKQGGLREDEGVDSASIFYIFPSESPAYLL